MPRRAQLAPPTAVAAPPARTGARHVGRAVQSISRGIARVFRRLSLMRIVLIILSALLAITCRMAPGLVYTAISPLPEIVYQPVRSALDYYVARQSPVRDGLTWIDVGDPQIRKSDRLPGRSAIPGR